MDLHLIRTLSILHPDHLLSFVLEVFLSLLSLFNLLPHLQELFTSFFDFTLIDLLHLILELSHRLIEYLQLLISLLLYFADLSRLICTDVTNSSL